MKGTKDPISVKMLLLDLLCVLCAGAIVGSAYHFFQNSNGFAPGGVGGLATITHHLLGESSIGWSILMLAFNLPIFVLVSALINRKHGVTGIKVHGMYTDTERSLMVCVIDKRQLGQMMKIIKHHPDTFATFSKVNEVFGNFKRNV